MSRALSAPADPRRAESFAEKMLEVLNGGALALAMSVGHRTGLFDAMRGLPPSTSEAIARAAGLHERYVREWLAAMASGGVVDYSPDDGTYELPPDHAAVLTRRASPDNLAVTAQFIPLLARVEDHLLECFRRGGGLGYEHFPRFHDVMAEESSQTVVSALFDGILPLVPGLADRLEEGIDVLDVGCGKGRAMVALASAFPNSSFRGYDLAREPVEAGRRTVAELGLRNLGFQVKDAARLREREAYDLITAFDAIHDQAEPDGVLENVRRALRPGGVFLMQDVATSSRLENNLDHPIGPFLYTLSMAHCTAVSLARDGAGLGTCWGFETAEEMLERAGFARIEVHRLPHDFMNFFCVARP